MIMIRKFDCVAIGGGPASLFSLIQLKNVFPDAHVLVLEKQHRPLEKIYLSGGGRCNLTHACFDPKILSGFYPRGQKELRGAFYHFQPKDTIEWFEKHGVRLKTESDGRMFPASNQAESVADALLTIAKKLTVEIQIETSVHQIEKNHGDYHIHTVDGEIFQSKTVLFGTGGNRKALKMIGALGLEVIPPVPSLFSFLITNSLIESCAGTPLKQVCLRLQDFPFEQTGSMMVTHEGLSGPAVLKLSAFAARALHDVGYVSKLIVDWVPSLHEQTVREKIQKQKQNHPKKQILKDSVFKTLPKKIWQTMVLQANIEDKTQWGNLSKAQLHSLVKFLKESTMEITGKSTNKQEFVTCGGVALKGIDFRTMQAKNNLDFFFAGEVLDIDGLTGGFNLQNIWTTGWIAGNGIAKHLKLR